MATWGIDLEGRRMKYEPWPTTPDGAYRSPSLPEREKTYGIKGEALAETLAYFESQGGDTARLVAMLNAHATDSRFIVDRAVLMDPERWYDNEYYFYFIMFGKKAIGRYDFRFGEGSKEPLSSHHRKYEQGFMAVSPFVKDHDTVTNQIPYAIFNYFAPKVDHFSEILDWVTILCREKGVSNYKEDIFPLRDARIDAEIVLFFYEFTKVLANLNNALDVIECIFDLYRYSNLVYVAPRNIASELAKMLRLTTTTCDARVRLKGNECLVEFWWKAYFQRNGLGPYARSIRDNVNKTIIMGFLIGLRMALRLPSRPAYKLHSAVDGERVRLTVHLKRRELWVRFLGTALSLALWPSIAYAFRGSPSLNPAIVVGATLASLALVQFALLFLREKRKANLFSSHNERNAADREKTISDLKALSGELLAEKKNLEEKVRVRTAEIEEASRKLQEIDRAKTDFFYNISHELRTPITMIRSPIEALISGERGDKVPKDDPYFKIILRNSNRLLRQVNNLLDFAKIEQGRTESRPRAIDLGELCGFYCAELESVARGRGIELACSRPDAPAVVVVDPELFEKAFFNLASNALKFTHAAGTITIAVERDQGRIDVVVSDTGIGIPPEKIDYIFERFAQVDSGSARHYEGTGLGLPLVKEIAALIGANIGVRSELGVGSEFRLSFADPGDMGPDESWAKESHKAPAYLLADVQPGVEAPNMDESFRPGARDESLLLVEDNADLVSFLVPLLERRYRIKVAYDGAAALEAIRAGSGGVDLVVSDIMMPIMDGRELHRACRAEGVEIPFLFLTARASDSEKLEALREGAVDYISKPFAIDELLSKIDVMVGLSSRLKAEASRELESRVLKAIRNEPDVPTRKSIESLGLSVREREVALILLTGESDKAIGMKLGIATKTASSHVAGILAKAGLQSRMEFIAKYR